MDFMPSRPRILSALEQEFELDDLRSEYWMVTSQRDHGEKVVSAVHIGAMEKCFGEPISVAAARGYAVRAHRRIAAVTDRGVRVRVSVEPDLFCDVPNTRHAPRFHNLAGQDGYRTESAVVKNPSSDVGAPCVSCSARTSGAYARNVYAGLPDELRPIAERRYPTFHLCPECCEKVDEECTEEHMRRPEVIETIVGALPKVVDEEARYRAAYRVAQAGPCAVPYLVRGLSYEAESASAIAMALVMIGEPAVPSIVDEAATNPAALRYGLVALAGIGDGAVPVLLEVLRSSPGSAHARVAEFALQHMREKD